MRTGLLIFLLLSLVSSPWAFARERIQTHVEKLEFLNEPFTVLTILNDPDVEPEQSDLPRLDRLEAMQKRQTEVVKLRAIFNTLQDFVAKNYERRGRVDENGEINPYVVGTAYSYPDPLKLQSTLREQGLSRERTKVDDFLARRSLTLIIYKGDTLSVESIISSIKVVQTDFARVNKDFKNVVPHQVLRGLHEQQSLMTPEVTEFEVENLSVERSTIDFLPFMFDTMLSAGIFPEQMSPRTVRIKANALKGPTGLYIGMGLTPYQVWDGVTYLQIDGADLARNVQSFFDAANDEALTALPQLNGVDSDMLRNIRMFKRGQNRQIRFNRQHQGPITEGLTPVQVACPAYLSLSRAAAQ